ncbi:alpha/beta fold hydrolase [Streptomyces sp. IBSBF 2435]|uniref:alpha/beta fold hydrolase n=1 Tax=Streptomyces sp. IBSBF 2435 TaxID=2903531 RepID=UPI002FDC4537
MSLASPRPLAGRSVPSPAEVRSHAWEGFRCESRVVRSGAPRLAPVLMIGGAFQRKESWGRMERALLDDMDVVTVDPPGWGSGGVLPAHHGADLLADAVCHMLTELGLPRLNIFSGSYGTAIAYRIAQKHPGQVGRMVLVGTMTEIPAHARLGMRQALDCLRSGDMEEFAERSLDFLMNAAREDRIAGAAKVRRFLRRRLTNLAEEERAQTLANSERLLQHEMVDLSLPPAAPVLAVTGEHDSFTTPDRCRGLAATCPDSRFAVVSGADHMLYLERTAELADLTTRFLAEESLDGLPYCSYVERVNPPTEYA